MTAKDFVKNIFPKAFSMPIIDNARRQTSFVIIKNDGSHEFIVNNGATHSSKAWTDAKKEIIKNNNNTQGRNKNV